MFRVIFALCLIGATAAPAEEILRQQLERTYGAWRESLIRRDFNAWQNVTASHRRIEVRNRIVSERRQFPAALFELPAPPPPLAGLRFLQVRENGPTAKAAYFGRVDFGVGGEPTDNLFVLSFVAERGRWLYDRAEFVSLAALPEVRAELAAGDLSFLEDNPEAQPDGRLPLTPPAVAPPRHIAKVYVFSPGREVGVQINNVSRHHFLNAREAEIIMGGAREGRNELQFAIRPMEGGTGREALTIRVYLLSQLEGIQPIKIYEYLALEGEEVQAAGNGHFDVTDEISRRLEGRR